MLYCTYTCIVLIAFIVGREGMEKWGGKGWRSREGRDGEVGREGMEERRERW